MPGAVTVVIPTKDRADMLPETLRSIRDQTFQPTRIVVADDGSTDDTRGVAEAFGVVHLFNDGARWGVAGGRNAGLGLVETEYVDFVDSDDLLRPHAFERLRAALESSPQAPFAYGRALSAHRDAIGWHPDGLMGSEPGDLRDPLRSIFGRNPVHASGALVRAAGVRQAGRFDPEVRFAEDHHMWVRLAQTGDPVHLPEVLSIYRHHPGNIFAPVEMLRDRPDFMVIAEADPRLARHRSEWHGVHLLEGVATAYESRRLAALRLSLRRLFLAETGKPRIVGYALRHFSRRRRLSRAGDEVWAADAELRDWLSGFR